MRRRAASLLATCLGLGLAPLVSAGDAPVVIELFTSEGCSSCPAAEAVVADLARTDPALIVLQFHVDYWDRLGWRDPYSGAEATARQQAYVRQLRLRAAYTPEAVVQGAVDAVGSDEPALRAAIAAARRGGTRPTLAGVAAWAGRRCVATIDAAGAAPGCTLTLALSEGPLTSTIARGENAGRSMTHADVVRAVATVPAAAHAEISAALPADADPAHAQVVALLADAAGRIVAAARIPPR